MITLLDNPLAAFAPLLDPVPEANEVTPGWIFAAVFIGLFAVTILLWLSMRKQLKKIRFDENPSSPADRDSDDPGTVK